MSATAWDRACETHPNVVRLFNVGVISAKEAAYLIRNNYRALN
jgi:hypothetical protein